MSLGSNTQLSHLKAVLLSTKLMLSPTLILICIIICITEVDLAEPAVCVNICFPHVQM